MRQRKEGSINRWVIFVLSPGNTVFIMTQLKDYGLTCDQEANRESVLGLLKPVQLGCDHVWVRVLNVMNSGKRRSMVYIMTHAQYEHTHIFCCLSHQWIL